MRERHIITILLCAALSGCSGIFRGFIDTQPRVTLDEQALADPSLVVGGEPVAFIASGAVEGDAGNDPDLLEYSPVIVQGFQPSSSAATTYDREDDALGTPSLNADSTAVRIDTTQPRVYARVEHATVNGTSLKQLVYAFWYPRRPVGSVETGSVDGGVLRITLDDAGSPCVYEYTQPCGCFHGVFVSEPMNTAATLQFGPPPPRRMHSVEPPLTGHDDWVVRDLIKPESGGHTTLYITAGKHFCQAIRSRAGDPRVASTRHYTLAAYSTLEHLYKVGGGEGSMFDAGGLVIGASRGAEQLFMGDLDHAGWPRHLDKMLIHWDSERWTDPTLLASKLRLPAVVTDRTAVAPASGAGAVLATASIEQPEPISGGSGAQGRRLLLFTNSHCTGCQLTKKSISESPRLQKAISGWNYRVIDTATPEGDQLAGQYRVTLVPVLVGFDGDRELFRDDDIDTADKIAAEISRYR